MDVCAPREIIVNCFVYSEARRKENKKPRLQERGKEQELKRIKGKKERKQESRKERVTCTHANFLNIQLYMYTNIPTKQFTFVFRFLTLPLCVHDSGSEDSGLLVRGENQI